MYWHVNIEHSQYGPMHRLTLDNGTTVRRGGGYVSERSQMPVDSKITSTVAPLPHYTYSTTYHNINE